MSFKNFVINLMKWNQRCYIFTKGPIFLLSGRIFGPFWRKIVWKELATTLAAGDDWRGWPGRRRRGQWGRFPTDHEEDRPLLITGFALWPNGSRHQTSDLGIAGSSPARVVLFIFPTVFRIRIRIWSLIQSGQWIRIRIRIRNPYQDSGGAKMNYKNIEKHY